MTPELIALLTTYGIPALAFLVGHYQILQPLLGKVLPAPRKPTDPLIRPLGQGAVIDLLGQLFAVIATHPTATQDEKANAIVALSKASQIVKGA